MPTLATERFGNPRDPALVLVMGATASRDWWPVAFCEGLAARGVFVIRYDTRDTGQSPTCPPGAPDYRLEDLASAFNYGSLRESRDWSGEAARIVQPVLVIHGSDDPILPIEKGRALGAIIPGARLVEVPGLGHEIPGPFVPRLVDEVARFVTGH